MRSSPLLSPRVVGGPGVPCSVGIPEQATCRTTRQQTGWTSRTYGQEKICSYVKGDMRRIWA